MFHPGVSLRDEYWPAPTLLGRGPLHQIQLPVPPAPLSSPSPRELEREWEAMMLAGVDSEHRARWVEQGLRRFPYSTLLWQEKIHLKRSSGDFAGAARSLEQAFRLRPNEPQIWSLKMDFAVRARHRDEFQYFRDVLAALVYASEVGRDDLEKYGPVPQTPYIEIFTREFITEETSTLFLIGEEIIAEEERDLLYRFRLMPDVHGSPLRFEGHLISPDCTQLRLDVVTAQGRQLVDFVNESDFDISALADLASHVLKQKRIVYQGLW
jgi:hypothetical protein